MKKITGIQGFLIIAAVVSLAGLAFANGGGMTGGGSGMGPGMMDNGSGNSYGNNYGMMNQGNQNYGHNTGNNAYGALSRQDAARLQQARSNFEQNTRQLRSDIQNKQTALKGALSKAEPDAARISRLQSEISQLRSEYDQKALALELETRRILPNGGAGQNLPPVNSYGRP